MITIPTKDLREIVRACHSIVKGRTTLPVLTQIWLGSIDGKLAARVTNLDLWLEMRSEATYDGPPVLVNCARLFAALAADADECKMETSSPVKISIGECKIELPVMPVEEFPEAPKNQGTPILECDGESLIAAVKSVAFAMADEKLGRFALEQVKFDQRTSQLIATDGKRVAVSLSPGKLKQDLSLTRAGAEAVKSLPISGDCEVGWTDSWVVIRWTTGALLARGIEAKFPNWKQAVPDNWTQEVLIPREEIIGAATLCKSACDDHQFHVRMQFSKHSLELSVLNPRTANIRQQIATNGQFEATVTLNPQYLIDALWALKCDEVKCEMVDQISAIRLSDDKGEQWHIIMPMRMN